MNGRVLAQVLLRVGGLTLIVFALGSLGLVFVFFAVPAEGMGASVFRANAVATMLYVVVFFVAGIVLIRNGDRIGAWLVSDLDETDTAPASAGDIQAVAFAVLGLYFVVSGAGGMAAAMAEIVGRNRLGDETASLLFAARGGAQGIVSLIAGAVLVIRRKALAAAWRTLRGQQEEPSE